MGCGNTKPEDGTSHRAAESRTNAFRGPSSTNSNAASANGANGANRTINYLSNPSVEKII
jgi:hypothetical protein